MHIRFPLKLSFIQYKFLGNGAPSDTVSLLQVKERLTFSFFCFLKMQNARGYII
jgi:hypothetical protein